jgi:hypothetical protein
MSFQTANAFQPTNHTPANHTPENFANYVAELQLHMTLQAKNLLPSLGRAQDSRSLLLHETQARVEKQISRQV